MKVLIYVDEDTYGGMLGMYETAILEVDSIIDRRIPDIATDLYYNLLDNYFDEEDAEQCDEAWGYVTYPIKKNMTI